MSTYGLDGKPKARPPQPEKTEAQKQAIKTRMAGKPKPHVIRRFADLQAAKKI